VPAGKLKEKIWEIFFFCILEVTEERKELDPELDPEPELDPLVRGTDPHQYVTDPQHCILQ
jgi:hypothetical protein